MNYQLELFHSLLNEFLVGESAMITLEGEVLAVRGKQPVSFGTLATATSTATKYLQLKEGDIAILNDPYSGGSLLSEITFIMAVSEDLYWTVRRPVSKGINLANSVEEEGVRIPPTPILQKSKVNDMILDAIQAHPACPAHFSAWVKEQLEDLGLKKRKLFEALEFTGFTITSELLEDYIESCKKAATRQISERTTGETRVDVHLDSGDLLRLNLEIKDGKILMDFSGTTSSKNISLTESATFGACFYAVSKYYGFTDLANTGSFSVLQITKPSGCWLLGKYPASTYKGMTAGVAAIQYAVELALAQLHSNTLVSSSSFCPVQLDLQGENKNFFLNIPGAEGATLGAAGADVYMKPFSLEQLEQNFPVTVVSVGRNPENTLSGKNKGGRGVTFEIRFDKDLQASWLTELTVNKPKIAKNTSLGNAAVISLKTEIASEIASDITAETLTVATKRLVKQGSLLTLSSGNGGNYGKSEKPSTSGI